jgi:hypothetical protein
MLRPDELFHGLDLAPGINPLLFSLGVNGAETQTLTTSGTGIDFKELFWR